MATRSSGESPQSRKPRHWRPQGKLGIAFAVLLLVVGVLAAVPFVVPMGEYRALLVWEVENLTGRQVQIDGLQLHLLPTLRLRVLGFHLENPRGFPAGDALAANAVDLVVAPRALLERRIDVTDIAPSGVVVNVLRDASGRTNFAAPVPAHGAAPSGDHTAAFTLEPLRAVELHDVQVTFADVAGGTAPSFALHHVSGTIGGIAPGAADWAKRLDIVANLRGAELTTSLLAKPMTFAQGALELRDGAARGTLTATVGDVGLSGTIAFARLDRLAMTFELHSASIDLRRLAALLDTGRSRSGAAATAHAPIAHGTIVVDRATFAPLEATRLRSQLDIYPSTVRLTGCTFSAYGGTIAGSALIGGAAGTPMQIVARARGMNVRQLLVAFGYGSERLTGALDASFRANTLLASDPERALTATGTFAVRDGVFPGMNVNQQLAQIAQSLQIAVPSGPTRFSYLGGDLHVAHERASSDAVTLVASGLRGTAAGSVGFDETLDYHGSAVLALPRTVAFAAHVPFTMRGTVASPQFALAGTPQLVAEGSAPGAQQLPIPPAAQELLKLIPGF